MKGRYYRHTNPLEISSSNSPSYGWKSMLVAKDLLKKGLRHTIGSGYNTRVWFDQWIPTQTPRLVKDNGTWRDPKLYVNHLIDHSTGEWRMDLIQNICDPGEISLIQSIRPSRSIKADGFCWTHTKSGLYTVKSGYELATLEKSERCVAVCSRLAERHCRNERACPRCGGDEETINHLLLECPPAVQTWALSDIPSIPGQFPSKSLLENFDFLLFRATAKGVSTQRLIKFPWIAWYLWKSRNDKLFNGVEISPLDSLLKASQESDEWCVAQEVVSAGKARESTATVNREEMMESHKPRCQVDPSSATNQATFGGGFVLDQEDGNSISGSFGRNQVLSPIHAEFQSLLWAMGNSLRLGQESMHFESDCLQMVKLIEEEEYWPSLASELDEFFHLRSLFTLFFLSFIHREFNSRAYFHSKDARMKNSEFFHVNIFVHPGLAQVNPPGPV
ncbi:PREDICTED: uncharacterized protein LOC106337859 [Brassica oleracea var. oleracea]|uniref:uncharacterized protein LOC106337859 n=1 Tax=Brassica oleracea var. oleracea TaxID=109376 RepID=UPI0006A6C7DB|nr:PREDICTED: uncharacterized protein LOC106337859 [Brassica oleracea var. oleracea]